MMQLKNIESLHARTVAQNTMLELLRAHYNAMIKIGEFRVYKLNHD